MLFCRGRCLFYLIEIQRVSPARTYRDLSYPRLYWSNNSGGGLSIGARRSDAAENTVLVLRCLCFLSSHRNKPKVFIFGKIL
jgi:hypothetical protein